MKSTTTWAAASLLSFVGLTAPSHAGLMGETVGLEWFYPTQTNSYGAEIQQIVGAGVEYPNGCCGFSAVAVDISDFGFTVKPSEFAISFSPGLFNGFRLDSVSGPLFSSVSYVGGDLGVVSLSLENGAIFANFAGQTVSTNDQSPFAQFRFTLEDESTVPTPATLALFGLGLAGLGWSRRQKG